MTSRLGLRHLQRYAVARSLFPPVTLEAALERLGFVQADPIRAPARAQDLILRHRVVGYRAGDLARRYAELAIEEDHFVTYGFLLRRHVALLHPRVSRRPWDRVTRKLAGLVLEYVREHGAVHPRDVDAHFGRGTVTNDWGGTSAATTRVLEKMHYRGLVRVVRREGGLRVYAARAESLESGSHGTAKERARALLALAVAKYAPVPLASLRFFASRLQHGAPQLRAELRAAEKAARVELGHAVLEGVDWYWPANEDPVAVAREYDFDRVRLLAPFDPVVWDRRRFEMFWGWPYRFEAYTPVGKRKLGYYAFPLLWRSNVVGWANVAMEKGTLAVDVGYVSGKAPGGRGFRRELDSEIDRMRTFLIADGET